MDRKKVFSWPNLGPSSTNFRSGKHAFDVIVLSTTWRRFVSVGFLFFNILKSAGNRACACVCEGARPSRVDSVFSGRRCAIDPRRRHAQKGAAGLAPSVNGAWRLFGMNVYFMREFFLFTQYILYVLYNIYIYRGHIRCDILMSRRRPIGLVTFICMYIPFDGREDPIGFKVSFISDRQFHRWGVPVFVWQVVPRDPMILFLCVYILIYVCIERHDDESSKYKDMIVVKEKKVCLRENSKKVSLLPYRRVALTLSTWSRTIVPRELCTRLVKWSRTRGRPISIFIGSFCLSQFCAFRFMSNQIRASKIPS